MMQPPTLQQCRAMLTFIAATDRNTWVRMGMALHSEYSGDDGFNAFDTWSQSAENYDAKHAHSVWKGFKPGKVRIGTLIDKAKRNGYTLQKDDMPAPAESPAAIEQRARERAEAEAKAQRDSDAKHKRVAIEAQAALDDASDTGTSEYLSRKRCGAHGLKYARDGALLVPMMDAAGALWNVQRIAVNGDKRFLPGGRKSGLLHWVGSPPANRDGRDTILIAEGYATAASLHEACAMPCAVAFDCGNLVHVTKAIRETYPQATIVLCADDDANNKAKHADGKNPGIEKARTVAKTVRGIVAIPKGLRENDTDFNDLAIHAGATAVKACVEEAIAQHHRAHPSPTSNNNHNNNNKGEGDDDDRFMVRDDGVFVRDYDEKAKRSYDAYVCPLLWVRARTRNGEGGDWGYQLEFRDPKRHTKTWILPSRMLAGDGTEYRANLAAMGFEPPQGARERKWLTEYILSRQNNTFASTVRRIGWHDDRNVFVLPKSVIQTSGDEPFILDGEPDPTFRQRGTLDEWRTNVAKLAEGNSRLTFALSCAFAGVLLEPAQQMGGGYHFIGKTSEGKSSTLQLSSSVWGNPSFTKKWRATDNGLEYVCASRCDTFLPLDELSELEPSKMGSCAYMLANGSGKMRNHQGGANKAQHEWRILFLSTGEISVQDHIRDGGNKSHGGQEVRIPDIPSDAGKGMGIFEHLHDETDPKAFAERVESMAAKFYGHAGTAFVEWLCKSQYHSSETLRARLKQIHNEIAPQSAPAQIRRVVDRFALVALAGELATEAAITGWKNGEATVAAFTCLIAWIDSRGGLANRDELDVVRHVREMVASNHRGRYIAWERTQDSKAPNVPNALGWRRKLSVTGHAIEQYDDNATGDCEREAEYVHDGTLFKREFCNGKDMSFVLGVLKARGYLRHDKDRNTLKVRLPGMASGKTANCVVIKSSILED
jgi:putative DNA primase/helicase